MYCQNVMPTVMIPMLGMKTTSRKMTTCTFWHKTSSILNEQKVTSSHNKHSHHIVIKSPSLSTDKCSHAGIIHRPN